MWVSFQFSLCWKWAVASTFLQTFSHFYCSLIIMFYVRRESFLPEAGRRTFLILSSTASIITLDLYRSMFISAFECIHYICLMATANYSISFSLKVCHAGGKRSTLDWCKITYLHLWSPVFPDFGDPYFKFNLQLGVDQIKDATIIYI